MTSERRNITQPADWLAAIEARSCGRRRFVIAG